MTETLRSWREVMKPRREVMHGEFKTAEFAADLVQAVKGNASDDYTKPEKFFRMTHITAGLRGLMMDALRRVTGGDGAAVCQIKTSFGGGKTHSMLALYHLMNGGFNAWSIPAVNGMLEELGLSALPRVNIAVIGGTHESASTPRVVAGIETHTLWGKIAAQLGGYDYVRESDLDKRAPGYDALQRMFDECGPCLVLIDELAAYGKKIYTGRDRPSDESFLNFHTFLQELTEAAKFSRNSLVVVAMPESGSEFGGDDDAVELMKVLDHVFERVQSVWKPVTALEGFRIVKRRLFDFEGVDNSEIERTAEAFSRMYQSNTADFPAESRELGYKERIAENYPIHPEIFDRLYGEWSTLENFQRTRGVLQLLAGVVHDLWECGDTSPLIMPGSIAYSEKEASRITVYLPGSDAWSPIIDTEVDGQDSLPRKQDAKYHRGCSEGVRLARTILLGSAPSTKAQNVRGIERERIFLGSVLAGENISVFRDGLNELRETLSYLYVSDKDGRYWFDTRPTLRRTVRNRAAQQTREQVEGEIFRRLKRAKRGEFGNVHVWPKSEDVADSQSVQLVILSPKEGEADAAEIVRTCGHSARTYRNTLLFVEADAVKLEELTGTVRTYLGWQSVNEDHETLNLTRSQTGEAKRNSEEYSRKVDAAILDAWSVVLVPQCLDGRKIDAVTWKRERAANGGSLWERVFYALSADELSRNMKAEPLRMELDNLMWKNSDDIEIKTLWEDLCRFCYLPRVLKFGVLAGAILSGMRDGKYFALAHGKDGATYEGLTLNAPYSVEMTDYLVKREVAEKLITPPEPPKTPKVGTTTEQEQDTKPIDATPKPKAIHNFSMSAELREDPTPAKYFMKLYNDIIAVLQQDVSGATFDLTLEVNMHAADPIPNDTRKIVTDNCKAHKVNDYSFY